MREEMLKFPAVFLSPFSYFAIVIIVLFAVAALCEFHDDSIIAREHAIHAASTAYRVTLSRMVLSNAV